MIQESGPKLGYSFDQFRGDISKLQDSERSKPKGGNPDLLHIDRLDLTEEDAEIYKKILDKTLTQEEYETAQQKAVPPLEETPADDFKQRASRKAFYQFIANKLNQILFAQRKP